MPTDIPATIDKRATTPLPARHTVEISDEHGNLIVAFIPAEAPKTSNP
jgi:hypothetical protein